MAGRQDQPQRRQRAGAAEPAAGGGGDRKHALAKHLRRGVSCSSCTRLTQSMVFLTSAGTEELYSGVTISTP